MLSVVIATSLAIAIFAPSGVAEHPPPPKLLGCATDFVEAVSIGPPQQTATSPASALAHALEEDYPELTPSMFSLAENDANFARYNLLTGGLVSGSVDVERYSGSPSGTVAGPGFRHRMDGVSEETLGMAVSASSTRRCRLAPIRTSGGPQCRWFRLRSFGWRAEDVIETGLATRARLVSVQATDVGFHSEACGTWTPLSGEGASDV